MTELKQLPKSPENGFFPMKQLVHPGSQNLPLDLGRRGHMSTSRVKNTPKRGSLKAEYIAQTISDQLQFCWPHTWQITGSTIGKVSI